MWSIIDTELCATQPVPAVYTVYIVEEQLVLKERVLVVEFSIPVRFVIYTLRHNGYRLPRVVTTRCVTVVLLFLVNSSFLFDSHVSDSCKR